MNETSECIEDLLICNKFPPSNDVGGIVISKRALKEGKKIDVVQNCIKGSLDNDFNEIIDELVANRILIKNFEKGMSEKELNETFNNYIKEGLEKIEKLNPNYKTITTLSWGYQPNFLALEYKLKHPQTKWTAEFSDPIIFDITNTRRDTTFTLGNGEYIQKLNEEIDKINEKLSKEKGLQLERINEEDDIFFLCEYLAYAFADTVRFTNENQREIMLSQFPYDIKDFVMEKSEVIPYPTLDEKYYHLKEVDYEVEDDCINIGYFGTYFGKRNFEAIYYAIESLDDEIKNKIKLHLFTVHGENLPTLTSNLSVSKNIVVNEKVPFLEFLNLCTKLDILLVNDTQTKGNFKINPYRPSKIADYTGSKKDIWGICERSSVMNSLEEIKYKSYIDDFNSTKLAMNQIVKDYSYKLNLGNDLKNDERDENKEEIDDYCLEIFNKKFDELEDEEVLELINQNKFLISRITYLNHLFNESTGRALFLSEARNLKKKNKKLSNENKKLKGKNKKLSNENKKIKKELKYLKSIKGSLKYHGKKILKK